MGAICFPLLKKLNESISLGFTFQILILQETLGTHPFIYILKMIVKGMWFALEVFSFMSYVLLFSPQIVLLALVIMTSCEDLNIYFYLWQHFTFFFISITFAKMKCKYPFILFHHNIWDIALNFLLFEKYFNW